MRCRGASALLLCLLAACGDAPVDVESLDHPWTPEERKTLAEMRLDAALPAAPSNRFSEDPKAAALGQALFFDPGLSGNGAVSCATCHDPNKHFTDGKRVAVGVGTGARNTPSIVGSQVGPWMSWDGRADSLWSQAAGPLENPLEMASDRLSVARHVLKAHGPAYRTVFGAPPTLPSVPGGARPGDGPLGAAWSTLSEAQQGAVHQVYVNALKAIGAYERLLLPTDSAFDRYLDALDEEPAGGAHLSDVQEEGLRLFVRKANCTRCHHGPMLADRAFHALGLPQPGGYDPGRAVGAVQVLKNPFNCAGEFSDTKECPELLYLDPSFPDFRSAFKTPTLRNVSKTAPYMHHGLFGSLEVVMEFYSSLPDSMVVGHRELTLQPLGLTDAEKSAISAFLESLDGAELDAALMRAPSPSGSQPPPR